MEDFGSKNTVSIQKSVRTSDIEEVGDERHLTFFEMLGNFSFGGYWKKEAIQYAHEFVTKEMGLTIDYVTVFEGEPDVPEDKESEEIWKSIDPDITVKKFGREDNFWGPTGEEGPCGPTTEIYVKGIEIWNIVFNEFYQSKDKTLKPLDIKGIDTGMGLERLAMVSQDAPTVFETDLFTSILANMMKYSPSLDKRSQRVIADHIKAAAFMISDGVIPSNTERGYVLRKLIRRAVRMSFDGGITEQQFLSLVDIVVMIYSNTPNSLAKNGTEIKSVIDFETGKFEEILKRGPQNISKELDGRIGQLGQLTGYVAYGISSTLGVRPDDVYDIAIESREISPTYNQELEAAKKEHQDISRAGSAEKFKGGLAGHSEMEVKYHTATHLLHQALHDVLGEGVEQRGSNITPERLRFDFSFERKLTDEEKVKLEEIVNKKINEALPISKVTMKKEEAEKTGARHFFGEKYPDKVSVYYIGHSLEDAYSKEFCGGPHAESTSVLGKFKIIKEEAVSAGTRRIKAVLE